MKTVKGWPEDHFRAHERGHENVARAAGVRGRVCTRRGGFVIAAGQRVEAWVDAAICYGGEIRARREGFRSGGAEGVEDRRLAEESLRMYPARDQGKMRRKAQAFARRHA